MPVQWENLPENMKKDAVRPYYNLLVKRKNAIVRKRIMDVFLSFVLTVLLSPVMLAIALGNQSRRWRAGFLSSGKNYDIWKEIPHL